MSITLFVVVLIVLLALEIFLSLKKSKWLGLIIPAGLFILLSIFAIFNISEAFTNIEGFGGFLQSYGGVGIWALSLKLGFVYSPVIISLIIYFVCRAAYKNSHPTTKDKEMKKMMAEDL
ncbi:MAG: hypothetical protein AB1Z23_01920 [Eubacteriales bacterium]